MACSSCGGNVVALVHGYDVDGEPDVPTNDRGMQLLAGDEYECEPYHGMFQGSNLFLACAGTEAAALFNTTSLMAAKDYAGLHECGVQRISVLELCHDRVVALFGA